MKKIFKRFLAYLIDLFIVSMISSCIMVIPFINVDRDNYNKNYKEYNELYNSYSNFSQDLTDYYKDDKLDEDEYEKLISDNKDYEEVVSKYYKDGKLSKKNYNKLSDEVSEDFQEEYKGIYYKLSKYSVIGNIVQVIAILAYFVGVNLLTKGQTVGKKIMKLQIINNKDSSSRVSALSYFIRTLILYNPIYYLAIIIGVYAFSSNDFYNWALVWSNIKNYLDIIIVIMVVIRLDGRGLHDLLAGTRVIVLDEVNNVESDSKVIVEEDKDEEKNDANEEEVLLIKSDNSKATNKKNNKPKKKKTKKIIKEEEE